MTLLHDFLNTRNQQGFQRLLDASFERGQSVSGPSTSGGKSWARPSTLSTAVAQCDVNARDWLGRTALHLSCAALENIEYVRLLLKHPGINVNLADTESHWTPLHRALYNGNFPAALLLLQRADTDTSLKDLEGYTAFDLYNSTVNQSKPESDNDAVHAELFTWGANRNAALGLGNGDDRTYPEQVAIQLKEDPAEMEKRSLATRFSPIHVRQVQMSKLHTAVITSESGGNIRVCGFGSGGRLGPGQHTQYNLTPLPPSSLSSLTRIVALALGQDHTIALTAAGEVLSWGLNRFAQLGYVVESTGQGRGDEPIQATPKKIYGPLRKEVVRGVAAARGCSACWTAGEVYTWGTNNGQLGYDRAAHPVQVLPRKVTQITKAVVDIALTDTAMACLLVTQQVECIWNDRHFRINFPGHAFPSEIQPYRPPQAIKDAHIAKITSCNDVFAALSSNGEVFIFSSPSPPPLSSSSSTSSFEIPAGGAGGSGGGFKPQRVWALRKKFSAVRDVALGADGSIIVCTESGHVFVRARNAKGQGGKAFKFQKVSYLQRVISVCANSTGAFGALRVDFRPKPVEVVGNGIAEDLGAVRPWAGLFREPEESFGPKRREVRKEYVGLVFDARVGDDNTLLDEEMDDVDVQGDVAGLRELCDALMREQQMRKANGGALQLEGQRLPHGADTMVCLQSGAAFPVHRVILAARSPALCSVLSGDKTIQDQQSNISIRLMSTKPTSKLTRVSLTGCQPLSALIFLHYLYTDMLLAAWDRRVSTTLEKQLRDVKANVEQVKLDLQALTRILDMPSLSYALEPPVKRVPAPSMVKDMHRLFDISQNPDALPQTSPLAPDVVLELADKEILCHSAILRARSEFFQSFFDEEAWTMKRWSKQGTVRVDMRHLGWHVMQFVMRFVCCGADEELFDTLDFARSVDDVLHFLFDVMAAANELLLDRLVLICSSTILKHANIHNACYILSDATLFHAQQLVERIQSYITANMEAFLESRMLDDIPHALVKQLSLFVKQKQAEKSPVSRSGCLVKAAEERHAEWLEKQDIPQPIARSARIPLRSASSKLSPPGPSKKTLRPSLTSPPMDGPVIFPQRTIRRPPSGDDIFIMDEADVPDTDGQVLSPGLGSQSQATLLRTSPFAPVWKAASKPRVDMKTVMAEAANTAGRPSQHDTLTSSYNPLLSSPSNIPQSIGRKPSWTVEGPHTPPAGKASLRPSGSPWRTQVEQGGARPSPPTTPLAPSPSTSYSRPRESVAGPSSKLKTPATPPRSQGPQAGLGPVITPTRQPTAKASSSIVRNASGGKAWTLPPVQPVTAPSPPTSGMSFVAIQHSQLEQVADPVKDRRSLREIQEEERAQQAEADFLKWWTEEEERVRQEAEALAQFQAATAHIGDSSARGRGKLSRRGKTGGKSGANPSKKEMADGSPSKRGEGKRSVSGGGGAPMQGYTPQPIQDTHNRTGPRPKQQPRKSSQKGNSAA